MPNSQKQKTTVALLSILSNSTLVAGKIVVGLAIGSVSVLSEAIHSGVDLVAAVIAYFAVKTSAKPADKEHPFGHGKIENISGSIEALLIFAAAAWIIYEAIHKLIRPVPLDQPLWGVLIMSVSVVLNVLVSRMLFKVGEATDSPALKADAWHLRTDVWTSVGVMGGLAAIWIAEKFFVGIHFHWIDPIAAIGVALLIIRAAYDLTVQASRDLMDVSLSPDEELWIKKTIIASCPEICGFHRLRTRKAGAVRFVEFHMLVDPKMNVQESHDLTAVLTTKIERRFPRSSVTIHIEPCDGSCSPVCREGCLLPEEEREKARRRYRSKPGQRPDP